MKARAIQKNIHLSARKAGLVCDLIRHKNIKQALILLQNTNKKASYFILKILNSAIANATNNHGLDSSKMYVYNAVANQGTTIKRNLPRAKGSSDLMRKRHCHIEITLSDDPNQHSVDMLAHKKNKINKQHKEVKHE